MRAEDFISMIAHGEVDDHLDDIRDAISERHKDIGRETFAALRVDDRVRVKPGTLNKRYLDGAECTVIGKRTTKITVLFPDDMPSEHDPYDKYAGRRIVIPASCLEKVSEAS